MQGWDDQQQPHQHGKLDGGVVPVPLYPRVQSPCAWIAKAHWACGQVTIKKVIFSSWCTVQSEKSRYLWNICLQQKLAIFLYIHETQSWLSSWKKLKLKFKRTQSPRHFTFTPGKHSTGYSPSFPKAPALELAGELSPMLGATREQRMLKSLPVPFNCCYVWIFHNPRIFRVTKQVRTRVSTQGMPPGSMVPRCRMGTATLSRHLRRGDVRAQPGVPGANARAKNHPPCSFLFVPLSFCPFTFTSCQSRLPEQIQAKFCNYQ